MVTDGEYRNKRPGTRAAPSWHGHLFWYTPTTHGITITEFVCSAVRKYQKNFKNMVSPPLAKNPVSNPANVMILHWPPTYCGQNADKTQTSLPCSVHQTLFPGSGR